MPVSYNHSPLTRDELVRLFDYDPETGVFSHKAHLNRRGAWITRFAGRPAGWSKGDGYIAIKVCGHSYLAHRLAWLWLHGRFSDGDIDHISGDRANNAATNLREASRSQTCWNRRVNCSATYPKGIRVARRGDGERWVAYINHCGRRIHVGSFGSMPEAMEARAEMALRLRGDEWAVDWHARQSQAPHTPLSA